MLSTRVVLDFWLKKLENLRKSLHCLEYEKSIFCITARRINKRHLNIEATHLYVRFLPKDSVELETLIRDTTLTLFPFPLDYELTEGERYIDSTLIGNDFTWLYTRVPIGYTSAINQYEVIDELYMPMIVENEGINQQNTSQNAH